MICFFAFFSIALGLGAWLPNILAERGFTIAKSLNSIFWMTLAFPCASAFMMFALENFGRKPTAVVAFILTGAFGLWWANASTEGDGAGGRVRDDLLHPARRQLVADFHLRGVPDQRARFRLRVMPGSGPDRRGGGDPGDPVDPERLGAQRCIHGRSR